VILSHANLLSNLTSIQRAFAVDENSSGVIWLPPYHDMGLIGGILDSLFTGIHSTLMSPLAFLQKPIRWLQAISATRATISGGPNFAYDLCARKVRDDELATLDLSCWRLAFNGAETIRVDTMDRFAQRFAVCGFRKEAFYPCYGLAEATLLVTGNPPGRVPTTTTWSKKGLAADVARSPDGDEDAVVLVGCGEAAVDRVVTIVEPKTGRPCADRHIGEIWVQGPAVSEGYWNNPEGTQQSFRQKLHDGSGSYLRTGDLGFVDDGQLYVTGRQKDLIVLRGRNVFPQDIERTTENAHPAVRPGCVAAFAVEMNQEERLVVVAEVERRSGRERRTETRPADDRRSLPLHPGHEAQPEEPFSVTNTEDTLLTALAQEHQVDVGALVLIMPGTLPKTSSGKVQRHAARQAFLDGTLTLIGKENV
jgi:acyl-CoA synthetase (AMP-forming)/AMP-acid ligase II